MHFIICDDDPLFARQLCALLEDCCARSNWGCRHQVYDSPDALLAANLSDADALFLDVEMPGSSGLETARRLRVKYPDLIIVFVTSYIQYAPGGYEVRAFRYLLKPDLARLLPGCLEDIRAELDTSRRSLQVRTAAGERHILLRSLVYAEGTSRRHVVLHLLCGGISRQVECVGLLSEMEAALCGTDFLRIQRSYLVNMGYLDKISNYYAHLTTGEVLKVSARSYPQVCQQFLLWKGRHI